MSKDNQLGWDHDKVMIKQVSKTDRSDHTKGLETEDEFDIDNYEPEPATPTTLVMQTAYEEAEAILKGSIQARNSKSHFLFLWLTRAGYKHSGTEEDKAKLGGMESITRAQRMIQNTERRYLSNATIKRMREQKEKEMEQTTQEMT